MEQEPTLVYGIFIWALFIGMCIACAAPFFIARYYKKHPEKENPWKPRPMRARERGEWEADMDAAIAFGFLDEVLHDEDQ